MRSFSGDPAELEHVACSFCGANDAENKFCSGRFRIVQCRRCGLRYVNPRLPQPKLIDLYDSEYFKSPDPIGLGYEDYIKDLPNITDTFERRWSIIERHLDSHSRVLDVGCAYGFLLKYLRDRGYRVSGIEVSRDAAQYAVQTFGLDVAVKPLREAAFPDGSFDAITVWDVIEHFPDPGAEIAELYRILKPRGVLSIITPDSGSTQARFWGRKWVEYLRPEEHIYFFCRRVLQDKLASVGFELLDATTAGKYVSLDFVLHRLMAYNRTIFGAILSLMKALGLSRKIIYVDPKDKMFLNFRKKASGVARQ